MPTGVLLVNLGTPDEPNPKAVGKYLREFLMDPWVVDIATPLRWFLVNCMIVPRRSHASAEAYSKIWDEDGSPLLSYSLDLKDAVQGELGPGYLVRLAMRYGNPSIPESLAALRAEGAERVIAFPLYPQYSLAATKSSVEMIEKTAKELSLGVRTIPEFFDEEGFIDAWVENARETFAREGEFDYYLFSFHGLPERQVRNTDSGCAAVCFKTASCCDRIGAANQHCYRAQCFATARSMARGLGLPEDRWSVSFQSRLGRTPWIQPFTDVVIDELAGKGVKRLAVFSPAFVADCLETLEELRIRARAQFIEAGGQELTLVPSLNARPRWARFVADRIRSAAR